MNLNQLDENSEATITEFGNTLTPKVILRLESMGITPGEKVTKLSTPLGGAEVIQVQQSVFSLDTTITQNLIIQ
ncbi:ferrous iron transport protein A [Bacteriovoracaceae bacterium]|nr:ferrous iron transport protein A [Bacteriovoracaceae bacterium]